MTEPTKAAKEILFALECNVELGRRCGDKFEPALVSEVLEYIDRAGVADLITAIHGLFAFVREKHSIPPGQPFNCPHFQAISKAMVRLGEAP